MASEVKCGESDVAYRQLFGSRMQSGLEDGNAVVLHRNHQQVSQMGLPLLFLSFQVVCATRQQRSQRPRQLRNPTNLQHMEERRLAGIVETEEE